MDVMTVEELSAMGMDDERHDGDMAVDMEAFDDVSGGRLEPHMVMPARKEELQYFKDECLQLCDPSRMSE